MHRRPPELEIETQKWSAFVGLAPQPFLLLVKPENDGADGRRLVVHRPVHLAVIRYPGLGCQGLADRSHRSLLQMRRKKGLVVGPCSCLVVLIDCVYVMRAVWERSLECLAVAAVVRAVAVAVPVGGIGRRLREATCRPCSPAIVTPAAGAEN